MTAARLRLLTFTLLAVAMPWDIRAEPLPVGQIVSIDQEVRPRAWVQRGSDRVPAQRGMDLRAGDIVFLEPCPGNGWLHGVLDGVDGGFRLDGSECVRRISRADTSAGTSTLWDQIVPRLRGIFAEPPPAPPIPAYSLGPGDKAAAALPGNATSPWSVRNAALPEVPQNLIAGTQMLRLFWWPKEPPPYQIELKSGAQVHAQAGPIDEADAVLCLSPGYGPGGAELVVRARGLPIAVFPITFVTWEDLPEPRDPLADIPGPDAAALHGAWLLLNAGPEWRLQALAMLAEGEAQGSYVGSRLLRALIAGEWSPP